MPCNNLYCVTDDDTKFNSGMNIALNRLSYEPVEKCKDGCLSHTQKDTYMYGIKEDMKRLFNCQTKMYLLIFLIIILLLIFYRTME